MHEVLSYLLQCPAFTPSSEVHTVFDTLLAASAKAGPVHAIDYQLPVPKWQFLAYLADTKDILLHGSGDPSIDEFTPRQPIDLHAFGAQNAVYATSDGIWPMFYAILDRDRYSMMLHNASLRLRDSSGQVSGPYYYFSITRSVLGHKPWRRGVVYILPRATFTQEPEMPFGEISVIVAQWASPVPVRPLAKLIVEPGDFPFLDQIRGHDDDVLRARIAADPERFPWADEQYTSSSSAP